MELRGAIHPLKRENPREISIFWGNLFPTSVLSPPSLELLLRTFLAEESSAGKSLQFLEKFFAPQEVPISWEEISPILTAYMNPRILLPITPSMNHSISSYLIPQEHTSQAPKNPRPPPPPGPLRQANNTRNQWNPLVK